MDKRPIGVFDSGLGGLTVLSELKKVMPNESFIYFGDTARVPYGSKSKQTIIEYSKEIVNFLIKQDVKMIIIACGTASSLAYEELKNEFNIPIIDVISPTANNLRSSDIGIIATKASIKSNVWKEQLLLHNKKSNIYTKACPLFVPIVEEGLTNSNIADDAINLYLQSFKSKKIKHLILGCTHYPLLEKKIKEYMTSKVEVININKYCSKEAKEYLKENRMLNASKNSSFNIAYTTDDVKIFKENLKYFCDFKFDKVLKAKFR